jgi:hypothetical protein
MKQAFWFVTTERYFPARQHKASKSGTKEGQDRDRQIKTQFDGIFNHNNVAMASEFHMCGKPRCIFTLDKGRVLKDKKIATMRELDNPILLQCGIPLFAVDPDVLPLEN